MFDNQKELIINFIYRLCVTTIVPGIGLLLLVYAINTIGQIGTNNYTLSHLFFPVLSLPIGLNFLIKGLILRLFEDGEIKLVFNVIDKV